MDREIISSSILTLCPMIGILSSDCRISSAISSMEGAPTTTSSAMPCIRVAEGCIGCLGRTSQCRLFPESSNSAISSIANSTISGGVEPLPSTSITQYRLKPIPSQLRSSVATKQVRMRFIVHLIVQRILDKVALLFRASANFNPFLIDGNRPYINPCRAREILHDPKFGAAVRGGTPVELRGRTDVTDLADTVVAVVVHNSVGKRDAARRFPKRGFPSNAANTRFSTSRGRILRRATSRYRSGTPGHGSVPGFGRGERGR